MIYKAAGRSYYTVKFTWKGRQIQKRTRATNARTARTIETALRNALALGDVGILERKPCPTLSVFLKDSFEPFIATEFKGKPNTLDYYSYGVKALLESDLASVPLDRITGEHVTGYIAQHHHLKPTTINRDLKTLRRALSLAVEWGKLDRAPKRIGLAKGERQRERVLTEEESSAYLAACPQPWRDVATLVLGEGMRPGECYELCWEHVLLNGHGGLIQVAKGKSKAARRILPMIPAVYAALKARHEAQGMPSAGWVFPTGSASGHMEETSAKKWHAKALEVSKVEPFEPYCLRHTFGTRMAPRCDVFALARIMGHSKISVTERYVHPQADAIERAFGLAESAKQSVVTTPGYQAKMLTDGSECDAMINVSVTQA